MNIIKYGKLFLLISLLVMIPGLVSLVKYGLNLSIDFTGGSVFEYSFATGTSPVEEIGDIFGDNGVKVREIIISGDRVIVRSASVSVEKGEKISDEVLSRFEGASQDFFETVGSSVGKKTAKKSVIAVVVASFAIVVYIAYSFRNIPRPYSSWKFGVSAIIAMLHDVLVVVGIFSILGYYKGVEIDALFITAMLTVIGFSVHDSIVVFDRIRENLLKFSSRMKFSEVVNRSMVETLNRSFATSLTVVITLLSLLLLGGESISHFVLALLVGIVSGTYSSIFTASPILVLWEGDKRKRR